MAIATNMRAASALASQLTPRLQARITNAKTAGTSVTAAQAALADMGRQLSNATSQIVLLQKTLRQLLDCSKPLRIALAAQAAQNYLVTMRADISVIVNAVGIKVGLHFSRFKTPSRVFCFSPIESRAFSAYS